MELSTCGVRVYKRKRKCTSSPEAEEDGDELDKNGMEHNGGAPTCDAQIGSTMVRETLKEDKDDKLLVLREVLQKSLEEEVDKPKQNNEEEANEAQNLAPVYIPSGLAMKEKCAKLCKRQKGRLLLKNNVGKGPADSSSRKVIGPKQRSDPEIFKKKGANNALFSCLMSLKGKGIAVPNAALPNKVGENASASGMRKAAPLLRRKPSGFLKRNTKPNDWSEFELDALWVGVRRYGQSDWEKMLSDPACFIFKNRTPQDLSNRWNIELHKIFPSPQPARTSAIFPPISLSRYGSSHLAPNYASFRRAGYSQAGPSIQTQAIRNRFPTRAELPGINKDNKKMKDSGHDHHPIIVLDSSDCDDDEQDSREECSETTLSAW